VKYPIENAYLPSYYQTIDKKGGTRMTTQSQTENTERAHNALTAKADEHIMPPQELNTKESNNVGCFKV